MRILNIFPFLKSNYLRYLKIGSGETLIYTMGKVGSSAIYENLNTCYQVHNLDNEAPFKYFSSRITPYLSRYVFESIRWKLFYRKYTKARNKNNKIIKIISIVRDPIARNVSALFQNYDESQLKTDDDCTQDFFAFVNHFLPLMWFDIELKKNIGIDVYVHPFDKEKGWQIIRNKQYELLIIQLEKLSELEALIGEFLKIKNFSLERKGKGENISSEKWYGEYYNNLRKAIIFPKEYLDIMYESKYVKHFYTNDQINQFRNKWSESPLGL